MPMPTCQRLLIAAAVGTLAAAASAQSTRPAGTDGTDGVSPAAPATMPAGQVPGQAREPMVIMMEMQQAGQELQQVITGPEAILDADQRAQNRDKVLPLLRRLKALSAEAEAADPRMRGVGRQFDQLLLIYGDEATTAEVKAAAQGDGPEAEAARASLITADYLAAKTEAARDAQLDKLSAAAQVSPDSVPLAMSAAELSMVPINTEAQTERLIGLLADTFTVPQANQMAQEIRAQRDAAAPATMPTE